MDISFITDFMEKRKVELEWEFQKVNIVMAIEQISFILTIIFMILVIIIISLFVTATTASLLSTNSV